MRPALLILTVAVLLVLLIACINVANLLLARASVRHRESAVRSALGATRGRLMRQTLAEGLLLASIGGMGGIVLAFGGVWLLRELATTLPRLDLIASGAEFPRLDEVKVDIAALAFALAVSSLAGILFGLAPALGQRRSAPTSALRSQAVRGSAGVGRLCWSRGRTALVIAETGMALVVLICSGLLIRSFVNLVHVDAGYTPANVLTFQVSLPPDRYEDERLVAFAEELTGRLRVVPGVQAAAYANQLPIVQLRDTAGGLWRTPDPERRPRLLAEGAAAPLRGPDARFVSRHYFDAMGIRVLAGRGFDEHDRAGQPRVLLINQALARREFATEDPLGHIVYVGTDATPWQIVGVVEDVRQFGFDQEPEPQFFLDLRQWSGTGLVFPVGAYYAVRTDGDSAAMVSDVRALIRDLDAHAALFNVASMEQLVANTLARPRMYAVLLGIFAAIAIGLAAIGLFGVLAYSVAQRTTEIGVRMAIGAQRGEVVRLVLRQSLTVTCAGILLGLAGAVAAARFLDGMLFGLTPLDAATYAAVTLLFVCVAALASYVPARRAASVNPVIALRAD